MHLYPYQAEGVVRLVHAQRYILAYEMGLGKTPTAICALREVTSLRALEPPPFTLIVCPAIVRATWRREIERWAPELSPFVRVIEKGSDWVKLNDGVGRVFIASYEQVARQSALGFAPQVLIVDELHYAKNPKTTRARALAKLSHAATYVWGLTATLVPNEPLDLWGQLDLVYPGRAGSFWGFRSRYCNAIENEYATSGLSYRGLNPARADELKGHLAKAAQRVTKAEVAHLLPPLITQPVYIKTRRKLPVDLDLNDLATLEALLQDTPADKLEKAVEVVVELCQAHPHVCVLTHKRASAERLVMLLLERGLEAVLVHGEATPEERGRLIEAARRREKCVLVCTMHSVGIGIDLTFNTAALFAELYWRPADVIQAAGRFHRLSSTEPALIQFLCYEGTYEEKLTYTLLQRMQDSAALLAAGVVDEKVGAGLGAEKIDAALGRISTSLDISGVREE